MSAKGQGTDHEDDVDPADARLGPAAQGAKIEEKRKKQADREALRIDGLKQILQSKNGRIYLWDLLAKCGVNRTSFTGNSGTFFKEGERNIGLQVQADIVKFFPDQYVAMLKEGSEQ
jgi:hypothetical protein